MGQDVILSSATRGQKTLFEFQLFKISVEEDVGCVPPSRSDRLKA